MNRLFLFVAMLSLMVECEKTDTTNAIPKSLTPPQFALTNVEKVKEPVVPSSTKKPQLMKTDVSKLKTFFGHLRTGQTAVRAKKYDDGIAEYTKALKLDPRSPTALGEMGWAYFKKGELAEAERYTKQGLKYAANANQLGMFLYNRGRVAEAQGNKILAARFYKMSLEHRTNKIVRKRMDRLGVNLSENDLSCAVNVYPKPFDKNLKNMCKGVNKSATTCTFDYVSKPGVSWVQVSPKSRLMLMAANQQGMFSEHYVFAEHNGKSFGILMGESSNGMESSEFWRVKRVILKNIDDGPLPEVLIYSLYDIAERGKALGASAEGMLYDWSKTTKARIDVLSFDGPKPRVLMSFPADGVEVSFDATAQKANLKVDAKKNKNLKTGAYPYKTLSSCPSLR